MKILIVSPLVYGATVGNGGGVLCFNQLCRLAASHQVDFVGFASDPLTQREEVCVQELKEYCASVTLVPKKWSLLCTAWARLLVLFGRMPYEAAILDADSMRQTLCRELLDRQPDVVLIQFPQMAQYVCSCGNIPAVMDVQDSFSVSKYREFAAQRWGPKRIFKRQNWLCWVSYESRHYSLFDQTITITDQDRVALKIFSPSIEPIVVPAAVGRPPASPEGRRVENRIAFVGSFSHGPNVDAVRYFLAEIFPLIRRRWPSTEFWIAGKDVPQQFLKREIPGVCFLGFVADLSRFLQEATAVVIPLRTGGGIKIKILEAMAHGCAVVTTSIGAEQTGAIHGRDLWIADGPEAFAEGVVTLLGNRDLRSQLGSSASTHVLDGFGWAARTRALEEVLSQAVMRRRGGRGSELDIGKIDVGSEMVSQ